MPNQADPTLEELQSIQQKLDIWELEHLREHSAALHLRVEALELEVEALRSEVIAADCRADMFMALNTDLQEATGARVGLTRDGHFGVLQ